MRRLRRQQKIIFLALVCSLITGLLLVRLFYIQIVCNDKLTAGAVKQRSQSVVLDYNRGEILDRNGITLLGGKDEKILAIFPTLLEKSEAVQKIFPGIVPLAAMPEAPFVALQGVEPPEEKFFKNNATSGLVIAKSRRRYGPDALATHLVGHIGEADGEGKVGLELVFNHELQGASPTVLAAVVDGRKNLIGGLGYRLRENREPYQPYNLVLSIDYNIQKKVERIMDLQVAKGAVVVMDPHSGDILAMASRPNYMQHQLSSYLNSAGEQESLAVDQPLINRCILSYPPGSIFKIVVAAAALETGKAKLSSKYYCPGFIQVGSKTFNCQHGPHDEITFAQAFAHSCNAVFIELAMDLGREAIYNYARSMGLGKETGILLGSAEQGGETKGMLPLPDEMPFLGDLALAAIGQGKVEATPLQVACLTSVVANGGYLVKPQLVKTLQSRQGQTIKRFSSGPAKKVLNPVTACKLRYMMLGVLEYGTGKAVFCDLFTLGGKTGTAETSRTIDGKRLTHSWFTGILPLENSKAVITVFMEEPLQGSAAETFKDLAQGIYSFLD